MSDITTTTTAASDAPSVATATITTTSNVKPGWQTSEWALSVAAMVLTALYSSGVLDGHSSALSIAGCIAAALTALGYSVGRSIVKLKA